jgi:hypothetical protein
MPLLPQTRRALSDDLDEVEIRMERWVEELGTIVVTSVQYKTSLTAANAKLTRLRRGFQDARANVNLQPESS